MLRVATPLATRLVAAAVVREAMAPPMAPCPAVAPAVATFLPVLPRLRRVLKHAMVPMGIHQSVMFF